ncbi:hypothetical protein B0H14DRAFT_2575548 [Mycena olivaceomarginata]|nr:hypothetical protein B0H14DRAFT_2575548 [Mycena olivaceomarginata]
MNRPTFRKLPPNTEVSIIDQISEELASAFSKDPLARAILGEWPSSTSNRAREFFKLQLLGGLTDGDVFAVGRNSSVEGVAVVFGVGKGMKNGTPQSGIRFFFQAFTDTNEPQFNPQYQEFVDRAYGRDHQLKSLYLLLLGVRPSSQEKGFGTELLRGVQARAAELGVDLCWQTTTAPEFYRKLGFKAISDTIYGSEQGDANAFRFTLNTHLDPMA